MEDSGVNEDRSPPYWSARAPYRHRRLVAICAHCLILELHVQIQGVAEASVLGL